MISNLIRRFYPHARFGISAKHERRADSHTRTLIDRGLAEQRRPRLLAISAAVLSLSGVAAFAFAPLAPDAALLPTQLVSRQLAPFELDGQRNDVDGVKGIDGAAYAFEHEERIRRGDTIAALLNRLGVDDAKAEQFIRNDSKAKMLFQLYPGRMIRARTDGQGNLLRLDYFHTPVADETAAGSAVSTNISANRSKVLIIERPSALPDSVFASRAELVENERRIELASGEIQSSLFASTDAAGVPDAVAAQIPEVFSGEIDFYRDLRRGDRFRLVYEMFYQDGEPTRSGRLLAIEFVNGGKAHDAIWYQGRGQEANREAGQEGAYYGFDGRNLRRAFLKTPIEFSRISSGFGGRTHPILGTWRHHTGVDYASPTGTAIRTTADGVVAFAGKQNGYGNVVVIKHQGVYSTLYGHMSALAKGLRAGARVAQSQVIGYVGMTGWATGPHLHYEFRVNDEAKDPLRVAMPQALPIPHEQLAAFKSRSTDLNRQIDLLRSMGAG